VTQNGSPAQKAYFFVASMRYWVLCFNYYTTTARNACEGQGLFFSSNKRVYRWKTER